MAAVCVAHLSFNRRFANCVLVSPLNVREQTLQRQRARLAPKHYVAVVAVRATNAVDPALPKRRNASRTNRALATGGGRAGCGSAAVWPKREPPWPAPVHLGMS